MYIYIYMYTYIHIHVYIYIYLYATCYTLLYYRLRTMSQRRRSSSAEAQIPPQLADYRNWPPQASESAVPTTDCGLRESAASGLFRQRCAHRDCKIFGQSDRQNVVEIKRKVSLPLPSSLSSLLSLLSTVSSMTLTSSLLSSIHRHCHLT